VRPQLVVVRCSLPNQCRGTCVALVSLDNRVQAASYASDDDSVNQIILISMRASRKTTTALI
jgi:hypothetical protein